MLRSEAARYARWSAAAAVILAAVTMFVYLNRDWKRILERKAAPPPTAMDVARQSNGINFKKVDQNRTIFEVQASKSTEFKSQDPSLLEDVKVTVYGKSGDRHDILHTRSCVYTKDNNTIDCSGDVQIDLMSAVDAERTKGNAALAKAVTTHIETRNVTFDRASGEAQTPERVHFVFPSGTGEAHGLEYQSEAGTLHLSRDVKMHFADATPASPKGPAKAPTGLNSDVNVKGTSLDFGKDSRVMRLHGPAEAETERQRLTAGEMVVTLDDDYRAQIAVASTGPGGRPVVKSKDPSESMMLEADTLTAHFSPGGSVTRVDAVGSVHGVRSGGVEEDDATSDTGTLNMWSKLGKPKALDLSGNVNLKTRTPADGSTRALQTAAFHMDFSAGNTAGAGTGKPEKAETLAPGTMEWTEVAQGQSSRTKLQANRLEMEFGAGGKAKQLRANGNVRTERWAPGRPVQTASAKAGTAQMSPGGEWSEIDLQGDVRLAEGDHSGQGDAAVFQHAAETASLTGHAVARDATTETRAARIKFSQSTGDIQAEGGVRSTDLPGKGSVVQLARAPANITADSLAANSKSGVALYTGHARLWQGDSVLEANSIELRRDSKVLHAVGNVRAVFPQAAAQPAAQPAAPAPGGAQPAKGTASDRKQQIWHATSGSLTYEDAANRAHLEQNVVVQSADQKMRGPVLDLFFTRSAQPAAGANAGAGAATQGGSQQISRAVGTGGVTVEEGGRKATAERGEYTATTGKFVMTGGNPTLYDGDAGTTTGLQLTFFLADDTIIVDSANGSRTLTKHRVEK
jgi:lipopolysaccharide export system protein LptA